MSQFVHPLHLLFARHFVPLLLGDAENLELLLERHVCPLDGVITVWAWQFHALVSLPNVFAESFVTCSLHLVHHRLA